jgi:uncharacterized protein YyaL (SSP411 family)
MYTNNLINESSPYLLEHAHNPVNWYPWGKEALEKAQRENKPLIISIGYAACHWCHVMERESFSSEEVARVMNESFVAIKVDREERPDIDNLYMNAALLQNGHGGWPLNAFAMPDGRPFFVGTYFPKESWLGLLGQIRHIYRDDYEQLDDSAESLSRGVATQSLIQLQSGQEDSVADYGQLYDALYARLDMQNGGLVGAPKFPMPIVWDFLMQYGYLQSDKTAYENVVFTLERMALSGTYDQLGGGFHRYATDMSWKVPHFEKMLYDNAQLVSTYSNAYKISKNEIFKSVVYGTIDFVERGLLSDEYGFYSSLNADSEGEEGRFYVWEYDEVKSLLNEKELALVRGYYGFSEAGNWEDGKNICHSKLSLEAYALQNELDPVEVCEWLSKIKEKLYVARGNKVRPSLDDKIIVAWNALMMSGLVEAYRAFGENRFLDLALRNAGFLRENLLGEGGELWRVYKEGKRSVRGFLDDYGLLGKAFLDLYQITFDRSWLDLSAGLLDKVVSEFEDNGSGFFYYVSNSGDKLPARTMELSDNVIPASNSVVANLLFDMGQLLYREDYENRAKKMLKSVSSSLTESPTFFCNWAILLGKVESGVYEVAIVGEKARLLAEEMGREYLPNCLFLGGVAEDLPLLRGKLTDGTMIYICKDKVCNMPTGEVKEGLRQIKV